MHVTDAVYLQREFARLHERLDALERKIDQLADVTDRGTGASPAVEQLVRGGHKLQAIKAYQAEAGVGLAAAEAFIDRLAARVRSAD